MPHSDAYISTHDIDWFVIINGKLIHVASAGGRIPELIKEDLLKPLIFVANLPILKDIQEINTVDSGFLSNKLRISGQEEVDAYLQTFKFMAQKGLYSFDRTNVSNNEDNSYHLVAWPSNDAGRAFEVGQDCPILKIDNDVIDFDQPRNLQEVALFEIIERELNARRRNERE